MRLILNVDHAMADFATAVSERPALAERIQAALRAMAAQDCETVLAEPHAAYIDHEND